MAIATITSPTDFWTLACIGPVWFLETSSSRHELHFVKDTKLGHLYIPPTGAALPWSADVTVSAKCWPVFLWF